MKPSFQINVQFLGHVCETRSVCCLPFRVYVLNKLFLHACIHRSSCALSSCLWPLRHQYDSSSSTKNFFFSNSRFLWATIFIFTLWRRLLRHSVTMRNAQHSLSIFALPGLKKFTSEKKDWKSTLLRSHVTLSHDFFFACVRVCVCHAVIDCPRLVNRHQVERLQEQCMEMLAEYCRARFPQQKLRFSKILLRLSAVRSITTETRDYLVQRKAKGNISIDSFVLEMLGDSW